MFQQCIRFGGFGGLGYDAFLSVPDPCSERYDADPNAVYGCNTEGSACVITSCKDNYELKKGACVEKTSV